MKQNSKYMRDKLSEISDDLNYEIITDKEAKAKLLILCSVVKSLPSKEEVVSNTYNKVFSEELTFRKVFSDEINDAYYSGALDMHEELTK